MKGEESIETSLGAAAGDDEYKEKENYRWFHGSGVLNTGYRMQDKLIIKNR